MPTFGNTGIGASAFSGSPDIAVALRASAPEDGVIDSIAVYFNDDNIGRNLKAILYTDAVSPLQIAVGDVTAGLAGGNWVTCTFSSPPAIVGGTVYYIGVVQDDAFNGFAYDVGGAANQMKYGALTYSSPEATWTTPSNFNWQISIYANYTATGGGGGSFPVGGNFVGSETSVFS